MNVNRFFRTDSEDVDSPQAAGDSPGDPNKFFITAEAQEVLNSFWPKVMEEIRSIGQVCLFNFPSMHPFGESPLGMFLSFSLND